MAIGSSSSSSRLNAPPQLQFPSLLQSLKDCMGLGKQNSPEKRLKRVLEQKIQPPEWHKPTNFSQKQKDKIFATIMNALNSDDKELILSDTHATGKEVTVEILLAKGIMEVLAPIEYLEIHHTNYLLTDFPPEIKDLKNLKTLKICAFQPLDKIFSKIHLLNHLENFYLEGDNENPTNLPQEMTQLTHLKTLHLTDTSILPNDVILQTLRKNNPNITININKRFSFEE